MKRRKGLKALLITVLALAVLWLAVVAVDYHRCGSLQEPLFVVAGETADDGGSGLYRGLGYTVRLEVHIDAEYGKVVDAVEMTMFGRVVSASIQ